jgi:tellurite resistance protein
MHVDATPAQAHTILKAMLVVAAAGPAVTAADRASIIAAARYIFKLDLSGDLAGLTPPKPDELAALAAKPDLATEATRFATVMAFVDGTLDNAKLNAVLRLAATLGVETDFVHDIAEVAQGRLRDATAHMIRANLESITGKPWTTDANAMAWFLPYKGANADPALAARFHALAELPEETFGHAFAEFYLSQKYAFPGEEQALNFEFATPHDSSHLLAGYDTTPRGELLVSTFTAAMHRDEAMSGHVLPVLFSWHLGIALNEVAGAAKGALDPQEFWHAWARGEQMKVDLFGPGWDFWAATREPIELVRGRIGIVA